MRAERIWRSNRNVFARQVIRQSSVSRLRRRSFGDDPRLAFLNAGNVAVDIFQAECELIGINALGAASELHSLQLFDDRFEAPDLSIAVVNGSGHVAHRTLQKLRIGRKIVEIELVRGSRTAKHRWNEQIKSRQDEIRRHYLDYAAGLQRSGVAADQVLARQIRQFVNDMPAVETRRHGLKKELSELANTRRRGAEQDADKEMREKKRGQEPTR